MSNFVSGAIRVSFAISATQELHKTCENTLMESVESYGHFFFFNILLMEYLSHFLFSKVKPMA